MSEPAPSAGPVRPAVAVALTLVSFVAVVVAAFGLISLATDTEIVAVADAGAAPGVVAILAAIALYAAGAAAAVRSPHPSYRAAVWIALGCWLTYAAAGGLTAAVTTGDPVRALALAGGLLIGWPGLVVALAAAAAAWSAVALVRTRARRPRWPWEREED